MEQEQLLQEERDKPLQYVPVPVSRLDDDRIYQLVTEYGWEFFGIYTALELFIAARDFHRYPAEQTERLAWKLYNIEPDKLREALGAFMACKLLSPESLEAHNLALPYLSEIVEGVAVRTAKKRKAGRASAAKRQDKQESV